MRGIRKAVRLIEHYGPGDHPSGSPQSDHAAGGGISGAMRRAIPGARSGGFSWRPFGDKRPSKGYMVSIDSDRYGKVINTKGANPKEVEYQLKRWYRQNLGVVRARKNRYMGGWQDSKGRIHIDVSENMSNKRKAVAAGKKRNQMAIFDLQTFEDIPTGGTGKK